MSQLESNLSHQLCPTLCAPLEITTLWRSLRDVTGRTAFVNRALLGFLARQDGGPCNAGIVAELRSDYLDAFERAGHGVVFGGFDNDAHHFVRQGLDDSAPEHHDFRIKNVDEIGGSDANVFGGAFNDTIDELVASADGFAQITAAQIGQI